MVGESVREVEYAKGASAALQDVTRALKRIGKVERVGKATNTIVGTTHYGLQRIRLRVSVKSYPDGNMSTIAISAAGDDIWGAGGRKAADRLLQALETLDRPVRRRGRVRRKTGMSPIAIVMLIIGFTLLVIFAGLALGLW